MRKIVDTILPTTMVGSYPRPGWFDYQLLGRDARVAFKHAPHRMQRNESRYSLPRIFERPLSSMTTWYSWGPSKSPGRRKELANACMLDPGDVVWVSAAKNTGVVELRALVLAHLAG